MDKKPDDRPIPQGRGALIKKLRMQQLQAEQVGAPVSETSSKEEEAPAQDKPRGRAAFLQKLKERREGKVGVQSETERANILSEVQELSESVTSLNIEETRYYKGEVGKTLPLSVNYIKLRLEKDRGLYEYETKFDPDLDAKSHRIKAINSIMREIGLQRVFDGGNVLYLPQKITDTFKILTATIPGPDGDQKISVKIIYKKKKRMSDRESLHLYNVLFKRIMYKLLYKQMGRNYFNLEYKYLVPQYKLEIYPGFAVSVDDLEDGLMLCLDTQHKIMRTENAYELLSELKMSSQDPKRFKEMACANIIESCVFTKYNNKTYTIHDIAWDMNPQHKFECKDGQSISFIDYYKTQYNITIQDVNQPLLINRKTLRVSGSAEKVERMICLVPELCHLTGLTDSMRSNFTAMKDIAQYTIVSPNQRIAAMKTYVDNIKKGDCQDILGDWGLSIDDVVNLTGRQLDNEVICFGNERQFQTNNNADWSKAAGDNPVTGPVDMMNWIVFYTERDRRYAQDFADMVCRLGGPMGCRIRKPNLVKLNDDRTDTYTRACQEYITEQVQIVVFICPTMRTDRYSLIKKMCCTRFPVASQVINSKTLSNPKKVRTIVQKIALQMTCKLGGSLWTIRFPFKNWMICGIDVYHSGPKGPSVCGFVASLNESISRWFSMAMFQEKELSDFLKTTFSKALEIYRQVSGCFPAKVIVIRDGISDGQLDYCKRYEIEQMESVLRELGLPTKLCFIVVQKRINTRIFNMSGPKAENPPPGTVLDHSITRRHLHDFFLIPQSVRQGTVNPTHYIVLHDTCELKPDHVQRLCFKLCHLYYNWTGTIRVPAPCQYAHKLAGLVGQHIKAAPSAKLADKLYYL